jgi:hypothetical protein
MLTDLKPTALCEDTDDDNEFNDKHYLTCVSSLNHPSTGVLIISEIPKLNAVIIISY